MTTSTYTGTFVPTTTYDGALKGAEHTPELGWSFEGTVYDTPADEATVVESVGEALQEPTSALVEGARKLVFGSSATYTSQVLLAMATAYAEECDGGDGCDPVVKLLQETARRLAVIEALTM